MAVRFVLNKQAMDDLLRSPAGAVANDLNRRALRVVNQAKRNLRAAGLIDTGTLLNSITHDISVSRTGLTATVGTNLPYGRYLHEGTGIYGPKGQPIRPKNGKVLAWPTRGTSSVSASRVPGRGVVTTRSQAASGYAFARSVRGVPPTPFLRDALPAALT